MSCWVAGIDHDNCARAEAEILALLDLLVESVGIETPAIGLVQIVGQKLTSIESQQSRVKWVLGDGDQDAIVGTSNKSAEGEPNCFTCAICQVDIVFVGIGDTISAVDEICDCAADMGPSLGVASVGARGRLAVAGQSLDSVESIVAEDIHLCEWLIEHTREHLSVVSDNALANFLWISNV